MMDATGRKSCLALLLLLVSCSVKETRSGCPCSLVLDLDEVIESGTYVEAVASVDPVGLPDPGREKIDIPSYLGTGYERTVPKNLVLTSVVCGFKNNLFEGDAVRVRNDCQADPIMAFALAKECREDRELVHVALHKQYCRIYFTFEEDAAADGYPFILRVRAACNGFRLYDLSPVEGRFEAVACENDKGILSLDVPRQNGALLILELLDSESYGQGVEEVVCEVDLGERLRSMGYDWNAEDLDDASVRIDCSLVEIELGVLPWENEYGYSDWEI